ncbi:MAG: cold-shock protein [Bacteroidetes bacterium 43-16]|mgnify:CR=1 FL=1|nr:MAG: cold-shock protein [Bacteroidetes bacterium 43-16]
MADTFNKKALQQKRAKKKQDKLEKREERKVNNDKGKSLEEMTVYLDEFGNFTDVPPEQQKRKKINSKDILLGATPITEQKEHTGVLSLFFADKAYGFITEDETRETIFVHSNKMLEPITEKDKVSYEKEKTPKGFAAVNVRKIK